MKLQDKLQELGSSLIIERKQPVIEPVWVLPSSDIKIKDSSLFGIKEASYDLWKSTSIDMAGGALTMEKILDAMKRLKDQGLK